MGLKRTKRINVGTKMVKDYQLNNNEMNGRLISVKDEKEQLFAVTEARENFNIYIALFSISNGIEIFSQVSENNSKSGFELII